MRILANENFPLEAVESLRAQGHDVAWVRIEAPGSSDLEVIERAENENRLILTFDKDFGELIFRLGKAASNGVILFRIRTPSAEYIAKTAVAALDSRTDWEGHFSVVEDDRIRMTPIPPD